MNELALFAGAGGGILGSKILGWRPVCGVEINPFCARRLMQRQNEGHLPPFPVWDDVRTFNGRPWRGIVDVVSCGFPCPRFSSAARGRYAGENMWPHARRIIADVAPGYVVPENVSREAIDMAADDLEEMGYAVRCVKISASDMGGDHLRTRYWALAHANRDGELHEPINAKVAQLPGLFSSIWATNPGESRVVNGVADRVERLAATGNGQIPAMVALAWTVLCRN